jgi:hypothetical protein
MQQAIVCSNCGQSLPAGASFCANCGRPVQLSAQSAPTQLASTPPVAAGDNAPTALVPPPPPQATLRADAGQAIDPYASQYAAPLPPAGTPPYHQYGSPAPGPGPYANAQAPLVPPPPGYAPGPPPVVVPGGGAAPRAQPQKKSGRRFAFGCVVAILLVVLLCGGGGVLAFHLLTSGKGTSTTGQQASGTPGATSTSASTSPTQTLNNINRTAIYAGVVVTVVSAFEARQVSDDFSNNDPTHDDILKIAATIDFEGSRHGGFYFHGRVMGPDGNVIERGIGHGNPKDGFPEILGDPVKRSGAFYFEVPRTVKISDWTLMIGEPTEVLVNIPLTGNYDPSIYQEVSHMMGLNQPIKYDNGNITGVITKIITANWNPGGYEAPKGMRLLRVYFHVTNNTALPVNVGDGVPPQYLLIYPNGDRLQADAQYNVAIDAVVQGGESKDVGFDDWVIPAAPAPYTMIFLNPDGSQAGKVDFGSI